MTDPDYVTPHEAAELRDTDPRNIRRMIRTGRMPAFREGGRWRILRKDVIGVGEVDVEKEVRTQP